MAVKRYDGSQWVTVAGKGDQGTSSSIATWVKTASGGETSLSGNDDNSQPLSYTVGQELVFINGALQKRGSDYTATTGNSITGLTALAANDVVTVWTVNAFSVTNAISNTLVNAKGDLVTASGADVPAILTAPSTNDYVLTSASGEATGLKWAAPDANFTLLNSGGTALTGAATITVSSLSGYNRFYVAVEGVSSASADSNFTIRFNSDTGSNYIYNGLSWANKTPNPLPSSWLAASATGTSLPLLGGVQSAGSAQNGAFTIDGANSAGLKIIDLIGINNWQATDALSYIYKARYTGTSVISSISIISSVGNFDAGTIYVYGSVK